MRRKNLSRISFSYTYSAVLALFAYLLTLSPLPTEVAFILPTSLLAFAYMRGDAFLSLLLYLLFITLSINIYGFPVILFSTLLFAVPLYYFSHDRDPLRSLGFRGSIQRAILYSLAFLSVGILLVIALTWVLTLLGVNDSELVAGKIKELPVYLLVYAVVLAPLTEEVFFRSFLPHFLSLRLPLPLAVILANLLFAVAHFTYGSFFEIISAFLMGLYLYIAFAVSHDIKVPILIHALINLASILTVVLL